MAVKKTGIGVKFEVELYRRFRIHCIETSQRPTDILNKLIRDYLDKAEKRSSKKGKK